MVNENIKFYTYKEFGVWTGKALVVTDSSVFAINIEEHYTTEEEVIDELKKRMELVKIEETDNENS